MHLADCAPSVLPLPQLFDESFAGRRACASGFKAASLDCVSARTRICGKVSVMVGAPPLLELDCSPLIARWGWLAYT